jgi:small redox-active disulfide protein 2
MEITMKTIQILGTGCPKCQMLAANAEKAAQLANIEYRLVKVTDLNEIARFGVMFTPALAVDGQVKSAGKVLEPEAIKAFLT